MKLIVEYTTRDLAKADYDNIRVGVPRERQPVMTLNGVELTFEYPSIEQLLGVIPMVLACISTPGERMVSCKIVGDKVSSKLITSLR